MSDSTLWRVIALETHDAFTNMALDEACSEAVMRGDVPPTIRFYQWKPSAVSIGYFQSLNDEVALDRCEAAGVDVIRRRTGGGAVYHDFDGEITYSILAPEATLPHGITESYHVMCGWLIDGLRHVGIETEFKPINDVITLATETIGADGQKIMIPGKKISGNAQTRRSGVVQQHGTILYDVDVKKMFSLLKVGQEKIADKMIAAVEERVTCVKKVAPEVSKQQLYEGLLHGFTDGKTFQFGSWTEYEKTRAADLADTRYKTKEWNQMR